MIEGHSGGYGGFPELVAHPIWMSTSPIDSKAAAAVLNVEMPSV